MSTTSASTSAAATGLAIKSRPNWSPLAPNLLTCCVPCLTASSNNPSAPPGGQSYRCLRLSLSWLNMSTNTPARSDAESKSYLKAMHIDIFTLFPAMFEGPLTESILKRAQEMGALSMGLHDIRRYTTDRHHTADDTPYGGGGGMIMKVGPVVASVEDIIPQGADIPVIYMSPAGRVFEQRIAVELAQHERLALLCGHYEGIDERALQLVVTDEISIGDYVLTGGELAAMVIVDAVTRLLPRVLGDPDAPDKDSHATGLLEHPYYTRPPEFRGLTVPDVLISGHEANIAKWRRRESLRRTWESRPGLRLPAVLTEDDRWFLVMLFEEDFSRRAAALHGYM